MRVSNWKLSSLLLVLFASILFIACKKGENDPFISFRSRKARIVGEWKLEKGSSKSISGPTSMSTTFNGNSGTEIYDLDTTHFTYTYYLSFKKDGSYSLDFSQTHEGDTTDYYKYQGQWSFIQKNKSGDLKNKESILLSDMSGIFTSGGTTSSGSVSVPIYGELFILDQLENERLVMKFRSDRISAYSGSTSTGFVESELTFIPK